MASVRATMKALLGPPLSGLPVLSTGDPDRFLACGEAVRHRCDTPNSQATYPIEIDEASDLIEKHRRHGLHEPRLAITARGNDFSTMALMASTCSRPI